MAQIAFFYAILKKIFPESDTNGLNWRPIIAFTMVTHGIIEGSILTTFVVPCAPVRKQYIYAQFILNFQLVPLIV